MGTLWFCLVAVMIAVYVVLDGFDSARESFTCWWRAPTPNAARWSSAIGPVWDGNEVWLLAGGGTLYFAFPALYASSFSGFYLPLMIVLWLLILRGIAIEFRHHIEAGCGGPCGMRYSCGASVLLAVFFGAALGNVVRGVPLDAAGYFFLPLWTDLNVGIEPGHSRLVHDPGGSDGAGGARLAWIALGGAEEWRESWGRSRTGARAGGTAVVGGGGARDGADRGQFCGAAAAARKLRAGTLGLRVPGLGRRGAAGDSPEPRGGGRVAGLPMLQRIHRRTPDQRRVWRLSESPDGHDGSSYSLTVHNAAADPYGLRIGLLWWIVGMTLASGYTIFVYRHFAGKAPAVTGDR